MNRGYCMLQAYFNKDEMNLLFIVFFIAEGLQKNCEPEFVLDVGLSNPKSKLYLPLSFSL